MKSKMIKILHNYLQDLIYHRMHYFETHIYTPNYLYIFDATLLSLIKVTRVIYSVWSYQCDLAYTRMHYFETHIHIPNYLYIFDATLLSLIKITRVIYSVWSYQCDLAYTRKPYYDGHLDLSRENLARWLDAAENRDMLAAARLRASTESRRRVHRTLMASTYTPSHVGHPKLALISSRYYIGVTANLLIIFDICVIIIILYVAALITNIKLLSLLLEFLEQFSLSCLYPR